MCPSASEYLQRGTPSNGADQGLGALIQRDDHEVLLQDHEAVGLDADPGVAKPEGRGSTKPKYWSDCPPPTVVVVSIISRWVLVDFILIAVWLNLRLLMLRRSSDRADLQATSL